MIKVKIVEANGCLRVCSEGNATLNNGEPDRVIDAAASMLAYTLGQCLTIVDHEGGMLIKPKVVIRDGYIFIQALPKAEQRAEVVHAFWIYEIGVTMIARKYPKQLSVQTETVNDA